VHTRNWHTFNVLFTQNVRNFCRKSCDWCRVATHAEKFLMVIWFCKAAALITCYSRKTDCFRIYTLQFGTSEMDQKFSWKWTGRSGPRHLVCSFSSPYSLLIVDSGDTSDMLLGCNTAHCCAQTFWVDSYTLYLYKYVGWPWTLGTIRRMRATHILNKELSTHKCRWQTWSDTLQNYVYTYSFQS
jgi:hypothetical protein